MRAVRSSLHAAVCAPWRSSAHWRAVAGTGPGVRPGIPWGGTQMGGRAGRTEQAGAGGQCRPRPERGGVRDAGRLTEGWCNGLPQGRINNLMQARPAVHPTERPESATGDWCERRGGGSPSVRRSEFRCGSAAATVQKQTGGRTGRWFRGEHTAASWSLRAAARRPEERASLSTSCDQSASAWERAVLRRSTALHLRPTLPPRPPPFRNGPAENPQRIWPTPARDTRAAEEPV